MHVYRYTAVGSPRLQNGLQRPELHEPVSEELTVLVRKACVKAEVANPERLRFKADFKELVFMFGMRCLDEHAATVVLTWSRCRRCGPPGY